MAAGLARLPFTHFFFRFMPACSGSRTESAIAFKIRKADLVISGKHSVYLFGFQNGLFCRETGNRVKFREYSLDIFHERTLGC